MDKREKKEFEDAVWQRVAKLIEEKGIKQVHLRKLCEKAGMPVSQSELSKLYNKKKMMSVYEMTAIAKALNVPADFFISDDEGYQEEFLGKKGKKLIGDAGNEEFCSYFDSYYIYYNSTSDQENKVLDGKMVISGKSGEYCRVVLQINAGISHEQKKMIKKYEGRMFITTSLSGSYIIVENNSIGEICCITMRHRMFTVDKLECRIALCLTIGAGEKKFPTVHRMLLSRQKLSEEQVETILPYLSLYGKDIIIEKKKAAELLKLLDTSEEKEELQMLWQRLQEKDYYEVSVELLRRYLHLDREKFARFVAGFLKQAETKPYSKIYEEDDSLVYSIINEMTAPDSEAGFEEFPDILSEVIYNNDKSG